MCFKSRYSVALGQGKRMFFMFLHLISQLLNHSSYYYNNHIIIIIKSSSSWEIIVGCCVIYSFMTSYIWHTWHLSVPHHLSSEDVGMLGGWIALFLVEGRTSRNITWLMSLFFPSSLAKIMMNVIFIFQMQFLLLFQPGDW